MSAQLGISDEQFLQLLQSAQLVTAEQLQDATNFAAQSQINLYEALLEREYATDESIGLLIANALQVPFVQLVRTVIPEEVFRVLPEELAHQYGTVVFARDAKELHLATTLVNNPALFEMLAKKTGLSVVVHYATPNDIENTLIIYRKELQQKFEKLLKEGMGTAVATTEKNDPPIEKIVDLLVDTSYEENASDIHIEPKENHTLVRFRIDGVLQDVLSVPKVLHDRIVTRIKILSNLRTDEHLSAQDGKMRRVLQNIELDLRVSILPVSDGEKVVLRLLSSNSKEYTLEGLGMNERDLAKVSKAMTKTYGMILSTGPTGSGKTTSIYAILKILNKRGINITTIEDPVEYKIEGANQIQVNTKTNLTFANGLRAILRQDPNYVFVGEIRDGETAGIAVNAALTGHLVLSTLHTNDSAGALPRLIDMHVEPFLAASTVIVIIAQRLVRKICDHCRISYNITEEELIKNLSAEAVNRHVIPVGDKKEVRVYKGKGCKRCHFTGYTGRIGVFEVLEVTKAIKQLVIEKKDSDALVAAARQEGMTTMLDDGMEKISKGMTTIEEVIRVTKIEMT